MVLLFQPFFSKTPIEKRPVSTLPALFQNQMGPELFVHH